MVEDPEEGGRRHVRVAYKDGTVVVRSSKSGPAVAGSLIDISISGCLILTSEPLPVATADVIELHLDLKTLAFRVLGFVRHVSKANHRIGVEFHHLSPQASADLEEFVQFFAPL